MAVITRSIGSGLGHTDPNEQMYTILLHIVQDLVSLRQAVNTHQHAALNAAPSTGAAPALLTSVHPTK